MFLMALISLFIDSKDLIDNEYYTVFRNAEGKSVLVKKTDIDSQNTKIDGIENQLDSLLSYLKVLEKNVNDNSSRIKNIEVKSSQTRILDYINTALIISEFTNQNEIIVEHNRSVACSVEVYKAAVTGYENITSQVKITHDKTLDGVNQIRINSQYPLTGYVTIL